MPRQDLGRGANMKVLVTTTGRYCSSLIKIDLHKLAMQHSETLLPQVLHSVNTADRSYIAFVADPQLPTMYHNGCEFLANTMLFSSIHTEHHRRMTGACRLGTMTLSRTDLALASRALIPGGEWIDSGGGQIAARAP